MKKTLPILALSIAMTAGALAQTAPAPIPARPAAQAARPPSWMKQQEFAADLRWYLPGLGDFDVYDQAVGVEFSYRHWFNDTFGIAGAIGWESWSADGGSGSWDQPVDGDVSAFPFGASGLMRIAEFDRATLIGEAGLRYVFASSDLELGRGRTDTVDIGGGLLARAGLEVDFELTEQASLTLGGGLQLDLAGGSAEAFGDDLSDNQFEAFFLKIGLSYSF